MMRFRNVSKAPAIVFLVMAVHGIAQTPEYRAKADYLLLFLRYVTWPSSSFPAEDSPLVVGVPGDNPFGAHFESSVACAERHGRKIQVRRVRQAEDAEGVHAIFISRGNPGIHRKWLDMLRTRPILTVVESEREFESGAIIHLYLEDGHLRFDINLPILRDSGLRILSPMLVSARRIVGIGGSG